MKKALSRVLSLALVLVMVLGIMPMAAAADPTTLTVTASKNTVKVGESVTFTATAPTIENYTATYWGWSGLGASEAPNTFTYTPVAGDVGTKYVTCTVTYLKGEGAAATDPEEKIATGTVKVTVEPAPVTYTVQFSSAKVTMLPNGEYTIVNPVVTASDESDMSGLTWTWTTDSDKITIAGNKITAGAAAGTATVTGSLTSAVEGIESVSFPVEVLSGVTVSADAVELNVGEDKSIVLKSEPATSGLTATYKSADEKIAKVDTSGKVTGVTEGQTTVTVVVTAPEGTILAGAESSGTNAGKKILTVAVNVKDGAYIKADNFSVKQGDTHTLQITPVGVPADAVITYGYQVKDSTAATLSKTTNTTGAVTVSAAKKDAVSEITVTASYKVGNAAAVELDPINVKFSVYSEHTTKVQLLDTVTKNFDFADKKIFKSASYDGGTFSTYLDESLLYLISESGTQYITLVEAYGSDDIGTLQVANSTTGRVNVNAASRIVFTLNGKSGTAIFNYTLENADNLVIAEGTLYIETAGSGADITYTTTVGNAVTIDEDDFEAFWKKYGTGTLDHVTFDVSTNVPAYGKLHTSKTSNKAVTWTMEFEANYVSTSNNYDLDTVTYFPASIATKAYVEEIPFTCYSTTNTTMSGVMAIEVSNKLPFTDVKSGDWFYESVAYVYNNGIMNGTSDTLFSPNDTLTRAMVVTMLYRIEGQPATSFKGTFSDVKNGQWYSLAVEWAAKNNIVNGMGDGTFGYAKAITREQFAAILYRYADYKDMSTSGQSSLTKFSDYKTVSTYAESALKWAVYEGIINGSDGKLLPKGTATRAQAAKMIHYFLEGSDIDVSGSSSSTTTASDSEAYAYLAGNDFRTIKRTYSTATAQCAYVYAFTDLNGDKCVLVDVRYKIVSNYSELFLHNLTDGTTITDPADYYDDLSDRYYGATKIQLMNLSNEILGIQQKMLTAMSSVLSGGTNTYDGVFVDAATLNQ